MAKFNLRNWERLEYYETTMETAEASILLFCYVTTTTLYHLATFLFSHKTQSLKGHYSLMRGNDLAHKNYFMHYV